MAHQKWNDISDRITEDSRADEIDRRVTTDVRDTVDWEVRHMVSMYTRAVDVSVAEKIFGHGQWEFRMES